MTLFANKIFFLLICLKTVGAPLKFGKTFSQKCLVSSKPIQWRKYIFTKGERGMGEAFWVIAEWWICKWHWRATSCWGSYREYHGTRCEESNSRNEQDSQAIQYTSEVVNDTILKYIKTFITCFGWGSAPGPVFLPMQSPTKS